jgi:hypothetical protein
MYSARRFLTVSACLCWACCTPLLDLGDEGEAFGLIGADLIPPVLLTAGSPDARSFLLEFNEPVAEATLEALIPPVDSPGLEIDGALLRVSTAQPQEPGREYALDLVVKDARGNSQQLLVRCYGHNPRIPAMLINEFTPQGGGTHPDMVEILVLAEGNLAGACLYEGVCDNYAQRMLFPACEVKKGEYIVVHFKPEGIESEMDETEATDLSGGLDASPEGRDFWVPDGSGLSGNNGVLALYRDPFGEILDAVVYSNRTSASDDTYRGFGSAAVLAKVDAVAEAGAWVGEELPLRPEDAVDPEDSTATRSICRGSDAGDSGTKEDWHIVPTSSLSFGSLNCDEVYVP